MIARPSKFSRTESNVGDDGDKQTESSSKTLPTQVPLFLEIPQSIQRIPGTPKTLLESAWKYDQYLRGVLERNGVIFDSEDSRYYDAVAACWDGFLEQVERQVREQDALVRSGYRPTLPRQEWTAYIHGLRFQSAKDAMKCILNAIAPTRRELAHLNTNMCHLVLFESRKPWINSFISSRPHPLRSVGVRSTSFAPAELDAIFGSDRGNTSYYGTKDMLFPFLTFEYSQIDISIADTQGACCMGLAVRDLANLYQRANKSAVIDRIISGFSVSFDRCQVKIWGYYPSFDGVGGVRVHQRLMLLRSLVTPRGANADKGISGRDNLHRIWLFVKDLYEEWAPQYIGELYKTILRLPEYAPMTDSEGSQDSAKQG